MREWMNEWDIGISGQETKKKRGEREKIELAPNVAGGVRAGQQRAEEEKS